MASGCAVTSARRWRQLGILKTWLINQQIIAAYALGIPAERLSAWYRAQKNPVSKLKRS
jgi:hypothetical protein